MIKLIAILYLSVMTINAASAQSSVKPSITDANSEFVYKYLLGEIAGQRGDLSLASQLFLDLAKKTRDPRLAERAAEAAAYGRHQRLALDAATLWAELDPDSLKAQQAASQMMIATGNMKSAVPHIKKLLSKEKIRATTFLHLNELLKNQQDKKAVLTTIKELAQPYPESAESHFSVAQAAWFAQDIGAAENAIRKASQLRPDWEVCAQMLGQIFAKESPDKALDL
ncbi:MAG: tetratricopeptide repeat protein, partial [Methylophilaceae bacterium]